VDVDDASDASSARANCDIDIDALLDRALRALGRRVRYTDSVGDEVIIEKVLRALGRGKGASGP
jgi:hypothetical protein